MFSRWEIYLATALVLPPFRVLYSISQEGPAAGVVRIHSEGVRRIYFFNMSAKIVRVFKQPACMSQIDKQTIDGLNAAQDSLDTSEVDCSSPPGKNPR